VLEAAAELAAVCAAMKDGGGGRCFLHSGSGENRRSSRPELGTGEQEERVAASRVGTTAGGARCQASRRSAVPGEQEERGGGEQRGQRASRRSTAADRRASRRKLWRQMRRGEGRG